MAAISGEDRRAPARLDPASSSATSPARRRARVAAPGLHFVPEERLGRGAVPTLSLAQNTLLTRTRRGRRRRLAARRRASRRSPKR